MAASGLGSGVPLGSLMLELVWWQTRPHRRWLAPQRRRPQDQGAAGGSGGP